VGKIAGINRAMKGGFGMAAFQQDDLIAGAIVAVNCLGNVIDPQSNRMVAGLLNEDKSAIISSEDIMLDQLDSITSVFAGNTTIGAIVTNAQLTKAQTSKLASMTHDSFARTMRPSHTIYDGDTIFALSVGEVEADLTAVGIIANCAMQQAIVNAIKNAEPLHGVFGHKYFTETNK